MKLTLFDDRLIPIDESKINLIDKLIVYKNLVNYRCYTGIIHKNKSLNWLTI